MQQNLSTYRKALSLAIAMSFAGYQQYAFAQDPAPEPPSPAPEVLVVPVPDAKTAKPEVAKPDPAALKPFKEVIKGAKQIKGFLTLHQKDEKVWMEIRPDQFDKPLYFSINVTNSVGERGLYGGQMWDSFQVTFHRIGNHVQLLAKNSSFTAADGTPQAVALKESFSDSLLASATVLSLPDADSKAVLIDASALLFVDIPSYSTALDNATHTGYGFDVRNTSFGDVRADDNLTGLHVNAHFFVAKLPSPPLIATPVLINIPRPVSTVPDPRSMFIGFYYSFSPLPEKPMPSRKADDRIGHFVTTHYDFTDDISPKTAQHYVNRWRLEKKNPELALSEPVQPIVYWLDKNIPEKYRKSIGDGILEWNKAFERVGFKNAIIVKQQTDKDTFDSIDGRHAAIRWYVGVDADAAIGPSEVDPRTGEILGATIAMPDGFGRYVRRMSHEDLAAAFDMSEASVASLGVRPSENRMLCNLAMEGENQLDFATDLLDLRGEMEADSPQTEALAQAYIKSVIMHEVGHTLGLRHNFRASSIYSLKQLQNLEFTKQNGLTGSVMDYIPFNIGVKGEPQGELVMSTLGPYDYWAIEYAYRPLDVKTEDQELAKIAGRSTEPQLAFGTDEDAYGTASDPDVNTFDLGSDPLEYYKKSIALSHELWDRVQARQLKPGETYDSLQRSLFSGLAYMARATPSALKYIGGSTVLRDHAGSGRVPFTPVPAARQREALLLVTGSLFKSDSFKLSPELLSRLSVDRLDRRGNPEPSFSRAILTAQTSALSHLMSDVVATHLLHSAEQVDDSKKVLTLAELYDTVQAAVWSELATGQSISSGRRNLQREHLKFVINELVRSSPTTPADARSLQRQNAITLQGKIRTALVHVSNRETKAHLEESLGTLTEALRAPMQRTGA